MPRARPPGMAVPAAARDHLAALAPLWVGAATPMALVDAGTQQLRNGATVTRLRQEIDGAVLHDGELRVLMHPDGSLAAVSGTWLPATIRPRFTSSPSQALDRALDQLYGPTRARPVIAEAGEQGGWRQLSVAAAPGVRVLQARARRELVQVGRALTPVWSVEVHGDAPAGAPGTGEPVAHRLLVGDADGRIVRDVDLVHHDTYIYRVYAEQTGNRRPLDSALASFTPHPTGFPDGSKPGFTSSSFVAMDSFNRTFDPWLPHNATTTSGNNVEAFSDLDGSGDFSAGDLRPEVTFGRALSYHYDPQIEPLGNPEQENAGSVNAFFVANWMHDWWYDSGFTETTGNMQVDNYGRGGLDHDRTIIHAQFGATANQRDSAFSFTAGDGQSPEIFVNLDSAGASTTITTPSGTIHAIPFLGGPLSFDVTAEVVLASDTFPPDDDACDFLSNNVAGKLVLATRSDFCGTDSPIFNARFAGAIGVILIDSSFDPPRMFRDGQGGLFPAVGIGKTDGAALRAAIATGPVTVHVHSVRLGPERDDDVDNTTIAHEWGHSLHLRLASCEVGLQCAGMSEGWADFNALLMMLREGDRRDGTYALDPYGMDYGTFDAAYFGIRRFPCSLDRSKNALSFRHISDGVELPPGPQGSFRAGQPNSEPHATGEVWTSMLWEAFNALIDEHDVPIARRRMSDYIVAGLLLTPPDATFTEARDAILAAASALDSDDMLLMAAAFAGRGAGTCAVSPSRESSDNTGVVESGTLAARIEVGGLRVSDDVASCDHDGHLDAGETGTVHLTVLNAGPVAAEEVVVTTTASVPGVQLGAPIALGILPPFTSADVSFPVTILASVPPNTPVVFTVQVAAQGACGPGPIVRTLPVVLGVDEVAAVSRIDQVETTITPWTLTGDGADQLWGRVVDASGNHAWLGKDASVTSDTQLVSPVIVASTTAPLVITLSHAYELDGFDSFLFDGAVIEASTDGGATWVDVSELGADPGYNGQVFSADNVLFDRQAFGGQSPGFPARQPLVLSFGMQLAGQSMQLRFRIGTDSFFSLSGWTIDDIAVSG
ncbi:MAG: M36 family metallopeptidase, partial [Kofleriaceae bacterium]